MLDDWRILGVVIPVLLIAWVSRRIWGQPRGPKLKPVRRGGMGPGAAGAFYEMLNEDRRRALEVIVEQRAERRDGEDADGNLPELERPEK